MVSRRDYLHACSAGAFAALAGCTDVPFLGGDGDSEPAIVRSRNVHRRAGFGRSVAVDRDVLVVGAQSALNSAGEFGGTAFLYEHDDSWVKRARLKPHGDDFARPNEGDARLSFGSYVAAEGGTAVVGTADAAAAYTYERSGSGWQLDGQAYPETTEAVQERIYPNAPDGISCYGTSMAFDGETIVLSTQCEVEDAEPTVETVHVFEARDDDWREVAALQRDDPREWDRYGYSGDVDGDTLVVGSTVGGDDGHESQQTVVHVYERSETGWEKQTEVRPDGAYSYGGAPLHDSIALSGGTLAVGGDQPRTHVFERSDGDWTRQAELHPAVLGDETRFGQKLALRGDTLVGTTGAPLDTGVRGSAFHYERSDGGWTLRRRYSESDAVSNCEFGHAVALSENHVGVGGRVRREDLADQEVVYVFPR